MSVLDTIAGSLFWLFLLVVGVGLVVYAVDRVRNVRAILTTPTTDAGFVAPGTAEVVGTVHARTVLEAPLTGAECVAYEWQVEEKDRDAGNLLKDWDMLEQGGGTVPFALRDGTGEVLVDPAKKGPGVRDEPRDLPAGATETVGWLSSGLPDDLDIPKSHEVVVQGGEEPPERVAALLADLEHRDRVSPDKRRFTERRLDVGTEVYVLGEAAEVDETTIENYVGERFVVSTSSETRTVLRNAVGAVVTVLLGVAVVVVSGWLLLSTAGLV